MITTEIVATEVDSIAHTSDVTVAPITSYYEPNAPIVVDGASSDGLTFRILIAAAVIAIAAGLSIFVCRHYRNKVRR